MKISNPFKKISSAKKGIFAASGVVLLLFLASFIDSQHNKNYCKNIVVHILDSGQFQFVRKPGILKIINKDRDNDLIGRKISQINLLEIETRLVKNYFVKDAQAWFDLDGNLTVDLHQREPILRAIDPINQQYYLDMEGKRMPISDQYTPYVPIATAGVVDLKGNRDSILRVYDSTLFVLATTIKKDSFMRALTGQIVVENHNEMTIIPRLGNFEIAIGDVNDLEDKFLRLRSFYQASLPAAGWETYKKISVKFKNQIIANR
jgi:cell division protein FtsQ